MDTERLVDAITPEAYENLTYAVETGRWPDGTQLSQEQRDSCMQALMLYQSKHNVEAQHMTVAAGGEISFKSKTELKKQFQSPDSDIFKVKINE
ncbi:DUF1315 family protein [Vibrio sp. S4M6]|uniref:YeaC family protein n=1 Tax=Vibrio sinus TaxID=2946865 RepID=UPI00202AB32D|nr:DUF1315 family protein [Vibrio sinus]MCL9783077.1 DUF1315 family protein [Vibrio sinus]